MNSTAQRTRSVWMPHLPDAVPPLTHSISADVAIVGAGIAGLTTAYLLGRAGLTTAVLDAGTPGGGMTARTSGHLSCALDDRWSELIRLRGLEDAKLAADSHAAAIDWIDNTQAAERIACDFARLDGFLFLAPEDDPKILPREIEAAHAIGLKDVAWAERAPLPGFDSGLCLRFPRQGRFHPLKYLRGLIGCINRDGGRLFCARVTSVHGGKHAFVETQDGYRVAAHAVVVATNTPINDTVAIHTKQAPYRTYIIGARMPAGSAPDALCWDTADPYHYTRLQPGEDGVHDILIVGGEDHKSGQAHDMTARFERLESWTRERFPAVEEIACRWSGQVMEPVDYLGFLGRNPGTTENVYIATGDSGMGLTHGTIAGRVISDLILGRDNPWARLYDPSRITPRAAADFLHENLNVAARFKDYVSAGEVPSSDDIGPRNGAVIRRGLHKIAAYRDADGTLHERSAVCTHLGCIVAWNPLERCWDCPCHGSQFATDGTAINGPAIHPLGRVHSRKG